MALFIAALSALVIGITLGLLGGGGSILTVPVLTYILDVEAKEAIATSLLVVGATAAFAAWSHAKAGNVRWKVAMVFAGAGTVGAFLGGRVAAYFSGTVLLVLFAAMMVVTAVFMFKGRGEMESGGQEPKLALILAEGLAVGLFTGLVGAGGGFLVVPALVLLGGLSMKEAVGSSLVVIAIKSIGGFVGYASHVSIDWTLALVFIVAAIIGAQVGTRLSHRVPAAMLRRGFAGFVLLMGVFMLGKELL